MKKLITTIAVLTTLISCEKAEQCNCGTIQDDNIEIDNSGNYFYTLTVESSCSGVDKKVYVSYSDWLNNHVGDYTCITGVGTWFPLEPIAETLDPINKEFTK